MKVNVKQRRCKKHQRDYWIACMACRLEEVEQEQRRRASGLRDSENAAEDREHFRQGPAIGESLK